MHKIYLAMKQSTKDKIVYPIAAFEDEGAAVHSAESHRASGTNTWVEEVNYYKKGD